jgi:hypothetical protein
MKIKSLRSDDAVRLCWILLADEKRSGLELLATGDAAIGMKCSSSSEKMLQGRATRNARRVRSNANEDHRASDTE